LTACAGGGGLKGAEARAVQQEFEAAHKLLGSDSAAGRDAMQNFLQKWGRSAWGDDAALELAQLDFKERRLGQAQARLRWLLRNHARGDRAEAARLMLAQIDAERGEFSAAYQSARKLDFDALTPDEQVQAFTLLTNFDEWRENARAEFYWRAKWYALSQDTQEKAKQEARMRVLLSGPLAGTDFQDLAESVEDLPVANQLSISAAERALVKGDTAAAKRSLSWLRARSLSPEFEQRVSHLEKSLRELSGAAAMDTLPPSLSALAEPSQKAKAQGNLGVVLPLSGSWKAFGQESLEGILLAAGIFDVDAHDLENGTPVLHGSEGATPQPTRVRLIVRDSAGEPLRAAQAVAELSAMNDIQAIIGPLYFKNAEEAAKVQDEQADPVALVTLTSREEIPKGHEGVFRVGMTQRARVEALAQRVGKDPGFKRVAILYPRDLYGEQLKNLFWDVVEARGAEIVGVASYEPDATDFAGAVRDLVGYTFLTEEENRLLKEREALRYRARRLPVEEAVEIREALDVLTAMDGTRLPPIVDFDAVFIADSYEKVVLIAPQLAFHDVLGVRLLGAGGWNHPDLIRLGGQHVRNAIFAESFAEEDPHPLVQHFVSRYRDTFDHTPSQFSAQAFDAANLIFAQFAKGVTSRRELIHGLLEVRDYPGVSGVTRMLPDGNAWKRPFLLEVRWGRIESIGE